MANQLEEFQVPLEGPGFIARRNGDFRPGEFKRLSNVEILDGSLVNRRSIKTFEDLATAATSIDNPIAFIGNLNDFSIATSLAEQVAFGPDGVIPMWDQSMLTVPAGADSFHKIVGFFRYNNQNYWITLEYETSVAFTVKLFFGPIEPTGDEPSAYDNAYYTSDLDSSETTLLTIPTTSSDFTKFNINNFFIYGERLWLSTTVGLYFSAPTDPSNFVPPDGGFFKFPDERINYSIALRDSISIFCDNSVHSLFYNTDPNLDAQVTKIAGNLGGDHACLFRDEVYFINQLGIYRITNNFVEKLMDNELDVGEDIYAQTLTSFENYLVINKFQNHNYDGFEPGEFTNVVRTNLMYNPVFADAAVLGWVDDGGSYVDIERSNTLASYGTHSLRIYRNAVAGSTIQLSAYVDRQLFLTQGAKYTFSMKVGITDADKAAVPQSFPIEVFLESWSATNVYLGAINILSEQSAEVTDSFTRVEGTITIPVNPSASYYKLRVRYTALDAATGTYSIVFPIGFSVYFDEIHFEQASTFLSFIYGGLPDTDVNDYSWAGTVEQSNSILTATTGSPAWLNNRGKIFTPGLAGNSLGYNLYFVNMDTGAVHVVDFTDNRENVNSQGCVVEVFNCPLKDDTGNYNLVFMVNRPVTDPTDYTGYVYYMSSFKDVGFEDYVVDSNGDIFQYKPKVDIEIDSVVPDGREYYFKKFRNMMLTAESLTSGFGVEFGFDNRIYTSPIELAHPGSLVAPRPHYPFRAPINQKAHSLSIRLRNTDYDEVLSEDNGVLEISDITLLWTPSGRSPVTRSPE